MKKYLIFDLDGTLIQSNNIINNTIYNYLRDNISIEAYDNAKYYVEYQQGISLQEAMEHIIENKEDALFHTKAIYNELNKIESEICFFDGVEEVIKELSKDYTLFLSTGNSDQFAHDMLKQGNIHKYFTKILGSSIIQKSPQHIDEFIEYTGDNMFYKRAIFIGDGQRDRYIAKEKNIDFIHIGKDNEDTYEIENITEIFTKLNIINKNL